jgi:formyltetrahydrofolate-dependent phosphoribosylglycinamide formyltransferase
MGKRLVVLASGEGTNLQAVLDACAAGRIAAEVVGVVSNKPQSGALGRARVAGVPAIAVVAEPGEARADYDARLAAVVVDLRPDLVVCAGWMRILSMAFLGHFDRRVVNLHPAAPGQFAGVAAIQRAHEERRDRTGVMVHYIVDEGVDDGPLIDWVEVPLVDGESLDALTARIHAVEHRLLVDALATLCQSTEVPDVR